VNYGSDWGSLADVESAILTHTMFMKQEKDAGKPHGEVAWYGMKVLLTDLIHRRDQLRAKAKDRRSEYLWVENIK